MFKNQNLPNWLTSLTGITHGYEEYRKYANIIIGVRCPLIRESEHIKR